MISPESIMLVEKADLPEASKALGKDDISRLVEWLGTKDDNLRYQSLLLLQHRSSLFSDVYPFWDVFREKIRSDNSYQRSVGLMLLADNAKWDTANKMEDTISEFLAVLKDEKPITVRQCIQALGKIASCRPDLHQRIVAALVSLDLANVKETMRKSILLDILRVLIVVREEPASDQIEDYIRNALSGEVLGRKSKMEIEALLR